MHEPPVPTARLIAEALGVPLAYMYCEDDKVAALLLAFHGGQGQEGGGVVGVGGEVAISASVNAKVWFKQVTICTSLSHSPDKSC